MVLRVKASRIDDSIKDSEMHIGDIARDVLSGERVVFTDEVGNPVDLSVTQREHLDAEVAQAATDTVNTPPWLRDELKDAFVPMPKAEVKAILDSIDPNDPERGEKVVAMLTRMANRYRGIAEQ
jgi:hypothetical protein